jgi:membrane protein
MSRKAGGTAPAVAGSDFESWSVALAEVLPPPTENRRMPRALVALAPWALTAAMAAAWFASQPRRLPPPPPRAVEPVPDIDPDPPGFSEAVVADPIQIDRDEPGRGRLADWPHDIPPMGWRDIVWRAYREITHDRLQAVSGSVTFYVLLAIFPGLGVFVSLYGLISDVRAVQEQLAHLAAVLPADVLRIVGDQMLRLATERPANLSAAFLVSLLLSIWSANAGMKSLFDGLNIAYDEVERRNYFYRTAMTYAFTFAFLLFLTLVTLILVATPLVLSAWNLRTDWLIGARWAALYLVVAGAFAIAYRYGPARTRAKWRWVSPGAAAAAVLWMAGSAGFSWFVNNIIHVQVTYGSLGAVIGFMLWVYFSVLLMLMGAELSAEIEHQTAADTTIGPPAPMGERGAVMADTIGRPFIGVRKGVGLMWGASRRMAGNLRRRGR